MSTFFNIKTLVAMQLRDKMDLSFLKNKRSAILTIVFSVVKLVAVTAIFAVLFSLCVSLRVFDFAQVLPDTVIGLLFTVIEIIAVISCTVGLSKTLYLSLDNKVLLTLPVTNSEIFMSKLALFYVFEIKRNINFTLPMFIAYGIATGAVWYYYPWMLLGFVIISLFPVLLGAVLSIPALYIGNFIRRHKWLQYVLMVGAAALVTWILVISIAQIPSNINILGQWGSITLSIKQFLNGFRDATKPFYYLCLLVVGGTHRIYTVLFGWDTLIIFAVVLAVLGVLFVGSYFLARPLFFKMASKQFEYEKVTIKPQPNKIHSARLSPYVESALMQLRSSRQLLTLIVGLVLPFIAILLLNKLYAAMDTSDEGKILTQAFNILIMLVMVTSFNASFATVYSREASSRNLLKTRPVNPLRTLIARISLRALVLVVSIIVAVITYGAVAEVTTGNLILLCLLTIFVSLGHLLWCAELDVMHNQAEQYQTIGEDFNNPNERTATAIAMILSAIFAVLYIFFSDTGANRSLLKCFLIAIAFLAVRIYLFVIRVKHYFVEN